MPCPPFATEPRRRPNALLLPGTEKSSQCGDKAEAGRQARKKGTATAEERGVRKQALTATLSLFLRPGIAQLGS